MKYQVMYTYSFRGFSITIDTTELINDKLHKFYNWQIFSGDTPYQRFVKFKNYCEILQDYYKYEIRIVKCSETKGNKK